MSVPYVCRQFVEDVTAYLEDALTPEQMLLVEAHLADCPHCREYLRQMQRTVEGAGALAERDVDDMPDDLRERLMQAFRDRPE